MHIDRFEAHLDGELLCVSRQPRLDSARELLRRGYSPDLLLTTRAWNRPYDSWYPEPIGELAKWTVVDTDRDGLRRQRWRTTKKADSAPRQSPSIRNSGSTTTL